MTKYEHRLLFLLAMVLFPTPKFATATDAKNQPKTAGIAAYAQQEIPTGFRLERYAPVWERNPFTLVTPAATRAKPSAFDKLFLTSWLKDDRGDTVFIQNLETNEVQRINAKPNQNNLRLIALRLNPDPHFVEALISDGKEQGSVKFRFDVQAPAGQTASPVPQMTNTVAPSRAPNGTRVTPSSLPGLPTNLPNAQTSSSPATAPVTQHMQPGG